MYITIDWEEIRHFLKFERAYAEIYLRGWHEVAFAKYFSDINLKVVFATTFDKIKENGKETYVQRKYGSDAFRILLMPIYNLRPQKVFMQLRPVRREENWKVYAAARLSLFEELAKSAPLGCQLKGCEVILFPRKEKVEDEWRIYWVCPSYKKGKREYHSWHEVSRALSRKILKEMRLPKIKKSSEEKNRDG